MTQDAAALARAEKAFKQRERQEDGAKAMTEYAREAEAIRKRTALLKELRLAKDAQERES
jgi:hypothetical protein